MHIFDFRWSEAKEGETPSAYFEVIEKEKIERKVMKQGEEFGILLESANPECVGAYVNKEYRPCPQKAQGVKKCEICKKAEDYFPCQFCNGFNCSRFRDEKIENCDADHFVYLALFDSQTVKVGVSRSSRQKTRLYEQGAHLVCIFARGLSGVMARRVENTLAKHGFVDKVKVGQKKDILVPEISFEEGKKILLEKQQYAQEQVMHFMPETKKFFVEGELWDMRAFYSLDFENLEDSSLPKEFLKLEEGDSVGGKLALVKGGFLGIDTGRELAILSAKDFVGKKISLEKCEHGINKTGGFQGGLF